MKKLFIFGFCGVLFFSYGVRASSTVVGEYNSWKVFYDSKLSFLYLENGIDRVEWEEKQNKPIILENLLIHGFSEDIALPIRVFDLSTGKKYRFRNLVKEDYKTENLLFFERIISPSGEKLAIKVWKDGVNNTGYCIFDIEEIRESLSKQDELIFLEKYSCLDFSPSVDSFSDFKWISDNEVSYQSFGNILITDNIDFSNPREIPLKEKLLFTDLALDHPLYESVLQAVEEGWISGYPDGTIKLENTVNRAEFAKMLTLAFDKSANPEESHIVKFPDLEKNAWYRVFLAKAVELGVMSGYPDGTMKPAQTINAAEASKMVLEIEGTDISETEIWYEGYRQELLKLEEPPSYITNSEMDYLITRGDAIELILKVKGK